MKIKIILIVLTLVVGITGNLFAQQVQQKRAPEFAKDEVLVKFKGGINSNSMQSFNTNHNINVLHEYKRISVSLYHINDSRSVHSVVSELNSDPQVEYAEPNYVLKANVIPNDPNFPLQWGMHNTGQTGGVVDADIDAPEAWDFVSGTTTSSVVVGVIDTGVDYTHPDLVNNIWNNPGEITGNGIDDDLNGFIDDTRGWDFANNDNDPFDDNEHGTHVSGIIAAGGDNGQFVAGVHWQAKIMGLKFLDASGSGFTSDAIPAILYASANGADLTNNSWGGGGFSQALKDAIDATSNTLFVAAAGNSGMNTDVSPAYPASYDSANILSVASTTDTDSLSVFSNFGALTVDIGAPGSSIISTVPGSSTATFDGTSMASPHAAGVAALVLCVNPGMPVQVLKDTIMLSVDPLASLSGVVVTGGRLNAFSALTGVSAPLSPIAGFSADTFCGPAPLTVNFTNLSVAMQPATYSWDFGDGSPLETVENPSHIFTSDGLFDVTLTVTDTNSLSDSFVMSVNTIDGADYIVESSNDLGGPSFNWVEINTTGSPLNLGLDDSALVPIPFTFEFFGTPNNQVNINSHGNLTFSNPMLEYVNECLPTGVISDLIAVYWDDVDPTPALGGNIYFETIGTTPDRSFIVEWSNVPHFSNGGGAEAADNTINAVSGITFQVILSEGSNDILFQYLDTDFGDISLNGGLSATVGLQNLSDTCGIVEYSCNEQVIPDNLAVLFSPSGNAPPVSLNITPPSGTYITTQTIDLGLILESSSLTIVDINVDMDGEDISDGVSNCAVPGIIISGGETYRCANFSFNSSHLGTGTQHMVSVTALLSDDSTVSDTVNWEILEALVP